MIDKTIYVFASNLQGLHCEPSAQHAMEYKGAVWGKGFGPQGMSFAIPTKDWEGKSLALYRVAPFIHEFILYAMQHSTTKFFLAPLEIAAKDIAPYFKNAPSNVMLPPEFEEIL